MRKWTILLVEDEMLFARKIIDVLLQHGHVVIGNLKDGEIFPAITAHDAIYLYEKYKTSIDLVIIDWRLKGSDGISVARRVKYDREKRTPYIYLTQYADPTLPLFKRAQELGGNNFVSKVGLNIHPESILANISWIMDNYHKAFETGKFPSLEKENNILFIGSKEGRDRVEIADIMYLETDASRASKACNIITRQALYRSALTIREALPIIGSEDIVQISQHWAVNIIYIDNIATDIISLHGEDIKFQISRNFRKEFFDRIRLIKSNKKD